MSRLPKLPQSTDSGYIYVVRRGDIYKIGFSRSNVPRRVKASDGELVLTVETGQQPASLEREIHRKFAHKRADGPGFKREWFSLTADDLAWLRGLSRFMSETVEHAA